MKVKIHIGRLTVEGVQRADATRAADSLRAHLAELVSRGISPAARSVERLDAGEVPANGGVDRACRRAAQRIAQHLSAPAATPAPVSEAAPRGARHG